MTRMQHVDGLTDSEFLNGKARQQLNLLAEYVEDCIRLAAIATHCGAQANRIAMLFLMQGLRVATGVPAVIRSGATYSGWPLCRCVLEAQLHLDYLLQANTEDRSCAYRVGVLKHRLKAARRFAPSGERANTERVYKADAFVSQAKLPPPERAEEEVRKAAKALAMPELADALREWERTCVEDNRGNRRRSRANPRWYWLWRGPTSVAEIAERVNAVAMYDALYRRWSQVAHAEVVTDHLLVFGQTGLFRPLHDPTHMDQVATFTGSMLLHMSKAIIERFGAPELGIEFAYHYAARIRDRHRAIAERARFTLNPPVTESPSGTVAPTIQNGSEHGG